MSVAQLVEPSDGGPIWAVVRYDAGVHVPFHADDQLDQLIVVLRGAVAFLGKDDEIALKSGDFLRVAPRVDHGWRVGSDPVELAVFAYVPR
ncbi:cupin domain-containing protein [Aeromicrobium panaciterrae]|uniref:cupin domain-containing protein n=1 Tax=Aeromicrobium panaciterrae TaxID=363861 RepID=UPI0031DEBB22